MKQLKISIATVLLITMSIGIMAQDSPNKTNYKSNPYALKMHVSPLITNIKSDTYNNEKKSKLGFDLGADFMYYYSTKRKVRASVSLGIGYTNYRSSYSLSYEHSVLTTDFDGDEVLVTEKVDNMNESQSLKFLNIPLKFGFEYSLSQKLDAYLSVGGTYGSNLKAKYSNEAIVTRTGYYDEWNVLINDVDVAGSPYFYPNNKRMTTNDVIKIKNNITLETVLCLKYRLNPKLSVLLGVKYIYGLTDITDENNTFFVKHDDVYHYSLNSLLGRGDKITTNGFGMDLGVQFNIGEILK